MFSDKDVRKNAYLQIIQIQFLRLMIRFVAMKICNISFNHYF